LWSGKYAAAENDFKLLLEAGIKKKEFEIALKRIHGYLQPWTYEMGGSVGAMNCFTDLGGGKGVGKKFVKDLNVKNTRPCAAVFGSAMYENAFAARFELTYGMVTAYDSILKDVASTTFGRYERN